MELSYNSLYSVRRTIRQLLPFYLFIFPIGNRFLFFFCCCSGLGPAGHHRDSLGPEPQPEGAAEGCQLPSRRVAAAADPQRAEEMEADSGEWKEGSDTLPQQHHQGTRYYSVIIVKGKMTGDRLLSNYPKRVPLVEITRVLETSALPSRPIFVVVGGQQTGGTVCSSLFFPLTRRVLFLTQRVAPCARSTSDARLGTRTKTQIPLSRHAIHAIHAPPEPPTVRLCSP